jgi:hypothetical protein
MLEGQRSTRRKAGGNRKKPKRANITGSRIGVRDDDLRRIDLKVDPPLEKGGGGFAERVNWD